MVGHAKRLNRSVNRRNRNRPYENRDQIHLKNFSVKTFKCLNKILFREFRYSQNFINESKKQFQQATVINFGWMD